MAEESTINLLRKLIRSPDCEKMNRSSAKGFLGELLVKKRLVSEGIPTEHLGNQNGFDLRFVANGIIVCADVKMSMPKDEFKWGIECWGWALQHENKKKNPPTTHYICVGCSELLELEVLYVVPKSRVIDFPKGIRQFSKVKHALVLNREALTSTVKAPESELYTLSQQLLAEGAAIKVQDHQRLSDACV